MSMTRLYYLCCPFGFLVSGILHVVISRVYPPPDLGEVDEYDVFGTFGEPETAFRRLRHSENGETALEKNEANAAVPPAL